MKVKRRASVAAFAWIKAFYFTPLACSSAQTDLSALPPASSVTSPGGKALPLSSAATPPAPSPVPVASATLPSTPSTPSMAAARLPSPIRAELPSAAPPPLSLRVECSPKTCSLANIVPDELRGSLDQGATSLLWEEVIAKGSAVLVPADKDLEIAGVLLDGSIEIVPQEKGTAKVPLDKRWQAFRAPGGNITLVATTPARIALVVAAVSAEPLLVHMARWNKDRALLGWQVRQKRIDTIDFAKIEDLAWGEGAYHARIGWEASSYRYGSSGPSGSKTWTVDDHPAMVIDLLYFSKDAPVAEHVHDKERECLAILDGAGELSTRPGGPAGSSTPIAVRPGLVTCIAAGMPHAWKPAGTAPFFALQVYTPPGPEQRFKKLAGKAF